MSFFDKFTSKKGKSEQHKKSAYTLVDNSGQKKVEDKKNENKDSQEKQTKKNDEQLIGLKSKYSHILSKPLITEKASYLQSVGQYVFEVHPKANKIEIKKAVAAIYRVQPVSVNIIKSNGKYVRYGRHVGQTKSIKKAVITLKEGDKIEIYEGV